MRMTTSLASVRDATRNDFGAGPRGVAAASSGSLGHALRRSATRGGPIAITPGLALEIVVRAFENRRLAFVHVVSSTFVSGPHVCVVVFVPVNVTVPASEPTATVLMRPPAKRTIVARVERRRAVRAPWARSDVVQSPDGSGAPV